MRVKKVLFSLRPATYSHSRGPVPRPEVCLRSVPRPGHRLLFLLRCNAAQTQVETGTGSSQRLGGVNSQNTQSSSLHRCPTWVARRSPSSSMTSITPCARPTARPSLPSLTLRSSSPTRSTGSWESHPSSCSAPQVRRWDLLHFSTAIPVNLR